MHLCKCLNFRSPGKCLSKNKCMDSRPKQWTYIGAFAAIQASPRQFGVHLPQSFQGSRALTGFHNAQQRDGDLAVQPGVLIWAHRSQRACIWDKGDRFLLRYLQATYSFAFGLFFSSIILWHPVWACSSLLEEADHWDRTLQLELVNFCGFVMLTGRNCQTPPSLGFGSKACVVQIPVRPK